MKNRIRNIIRSCYLLKIASIAVDLLTLSGVFVVCVIVRKQLGGEFRLEDYFSLYPFLLIVWFVFEKAGLYQGCSIYSGAGVGPAEEFRRIFYSLGIIFIGMGFANYSYRPHSYLYSRTILGSTYFISLLLIPMNRILFRKLLTRLEWWGVPVILIGSGETARNLFNSLSSHPEYGLRPIGYFTDHPENTMPASAHLLGSLREIPSKTTMSGVKYAILAKEDGADSPYIQGLIKQYGTLFPHLLLVPKALVHTGTGVTLKNIGEMTGLEIRHNLRIPSIYRIKRILDYLLTLPAILLTLPLVGLIALWIKLDSPGPIFFKHRRMARNGQQINIYKFRTMVQNAGPKLEELLRTNPELNQEWSTYGKLKNDPRITRTGKWLRKTSLDELPQLFNVLQGKITLVGPRPIIEEELVQYGESAELFDRVLPGLTGLWQVSGRNELTYADRARLDQYYVNNWSVWIDIYILAKTVYAVLFRHGAC